MELLNTSLMIVALQEVEAPRCCLQIQWEVVNGEAACFARTTRAHAVTSPLEMPSSPVLAEPGNFLAGVGWMQGRGWAWCSHE